MKVEFFTPSTFGDCDIRPDKYIRSIIKRPMAVSGPVAITI